MLLFTWNIDKNEETFRLALEYLRRSGYSFLACLQELPTPFATTSTARDATRRLVGERVRCLGVTPAAAGGRWSHGRVGLFCSPNIHSKDEDVQRDPRQRMAIVTLFGVRVEPLLAIGYHGESRQASPMESDRSLCGSRARDEIDKHWRTSPLIMLGDFNANPFDAEVCGSQGIFALRDRKDAYQEWASKLVPLGEKQRPLYNCMWSLLPESLTRPGGTHVYDGNSSLRWRLYDQILLSPDLIEKIREPPEILTEICGQCLATEDGNPNKNVSDHLPVQLRVTI